MAHALKVTETIYGVVYALIRFRPIFFRAEPIYRRLTRVLCDALLSLPSSRRATQPLAFHHRNRHASDLALGVDLHGLPVAVGPQRQVGGKSRSLDEHLDLATARCALEIAENIPARFAPVAGNAVALARNIAAQV